jgi:hypothetical protein
MSDCDSQASDLSHSPFLLSPHCHPPFLSFVLLNGEKMLLLAEKWFETKKFGARPLAFCVYACVFT